LFNTITGFLRPTSGAIYARGRRIDGLSPERICHLGIARTFQLVEVFPTMTVYENAAIAILARRKMLLDAFRSAQRLVGEEVWEILRITNLVELADRKVRTLGLPDRKKVELAVALASKPVILLLDEPVAGMSAEEKPAIVELIRNIRDATSVTTVLIEHDVDVVWAIADRVAVLHRGALIAEGDPEAIRNDPRVRSVYLGEAQDA
jgi:branched-chain amino acid transport system ATP-binding protein